MATAFFASYEKELGMPPIAYGGVKDQFIFPVELMLY